MILDQGHICFRTIRQIQGALRSIASGQLNILHQSRHPLSLCSKFDEDADQRHRANRDTIRLSSMLPLALRLVPTTLSRSIVRSNRRIDCRVKPCNDEGAKSAGHPILSEATTSPAALSPLSLAPCAVEKKFGEVASPAKNNRSSTGDASTARAPAWPGSACE